MAALGPFEPSPRIGVAVSGGADSLALALLAQGWVRAQDGAVLGLVVDHGLRAESAAEAAHAIARLASRGIAGRLLTLSDLPRGSAMAARARTARYRALTAACSDAGILHLLLGHHAADQAETVLIRQLAGSGPDGLAGMAALVETRSLRLLRPLLGVRPDRLRAVLRAAGIGWAEDPSNTDPAALRPRLRALRRDRAGIGPATRALVAGAAAHAATRAAQEERVATILAARVRIHAEGFALLSPGPLPAAALAAVLRTIAGAAFPPAPDTIAALAAAPGPATLAGVRLLPAGRLGPGLLVVREAAAMAPAVKARPGAVWDNRFRVLAAATVADGTMLGPLGAEAAALRSQASLPSAVLVTLPALRRAGVLVAVPHLRYHLSGAIEPQTLVFAPARGVAPAPFCAGLASGNHSALS